jgi:hypothetical protein
MHAGFFWLRLANSSSRSGDMSMDEDSGVERRRNNYPPNERNGRDRRDGRDRRPRDSGRLNADVDSYRPGGDSYDISAHLAMDSTNIIQ